MIPNKKTKKSLQAASFFALALLLIFIRAPHYLIYPNLWAEEGTQFLRNALNTSPLEHLSYVQHAGYLNLVALLISQAAEAVPLVFSASMARYLSVACTLIPIVLIYILPLDIFDSFFKKIVAILVVFLAPSLNGEVWLNSINLMSFFGLSAFLILICDTSLLKNRTAYILGFLLVLAGLSGPYAVFLLPAFFVKAAYKRTKTNIAFFFSLLLPSLIQVAIFLSMRSQGAVNAKRFAFKPALSFLAMIYHQYFVPFLGRPASSYIFDTQRIPHAPDHNLSNGNLYSTMFLVLLLMFFSFIHLKLNKGSRFGLIGLFCLNILTTLCAFGGIPGGRYAVLSGWALLFVMMSLSQNKNPFVSVIPKILLTFSLIAGVKAYRHDKAFDCDQTCLSWRNQVELYEQGQQNFIQIPPFHSNRPEWMWKIFMPPKTE